MFITLYLIQYTFPISVPLRSQLLEIRCSVSAVGTLPAAVYHRETLTREADKRLYLGVPKRVVDV